MRYALTNLIKIIGRKRRYGNTLDVGSLIINSQKDKGIREIVQFFDGNYIGIDMRKGYNVDLVMNAEEIQFKDNTFDTVICFETIEHSMNPQQIVNECIRVCKKGGLIIISGIMDFQIHNHPNDYYRFTPECMKQLMKNTKNPTVFTMGDDRRPYMILGIAFKQAKDKKGLINHVQQKWSYSKNGNLFDRIRQQYHPTIQIINILKHMGLQLLGITDQVKRK